MEPGQGSRESSLARGDRLAEAAGRCRRAAGTRTQNAPTGPARMPAFDRTFASSLAFWAFRPRQDRAAKICSFFTLPCNSPVILAVRSAPSTPGFEGLQLNMSSRSEAYRPSLSARCKKKQQISHRLHVFHSAAVASVPEKERAASPSRLSSSAVQRSSAAKRRRAATCLPCFLARDVRYLSQLFVGSNSWLQSGRGSGSSFLAGNTLGSFPSWPGGRASLTPSHLQTLCKTMRSANSDNILPHEPG